MTMQNDLICPHCDASEHHYIGSANPKSETFSSDVRAYVCLNCGQGFFKYKSVISQIMTFDVVDEGYIPKQKEVEYNTKIYDILQITNKKYGTFFSKTLYQEIVDSINANQFYMPLLGMRTLLNEYVVEKLKASRENGFKANIRILFKSGLVSAEERDALLYISELGSIAAHRGASLLIIRTEIISCLKFMENIVIRLAEMPQHAQ